MVRFLVPALTLLVSAVLILLTYFFQSKTMTILFWIFYVLSLVIIFFFELSVLTGFYDLLSYRPILATVLVILGLAAFVAVGLLLRWLLADALMYWLTSTIFPAAASILYVIDILQKR
jgi:hypothetical protein